jgi:hypothetical protein
MLAKHKIVIFGTSLDIIKLLSVERVVMTKVTACYAWYW